MTLSDNLWNPYDEPVPSDVEGDAITLVDGQTFCVSRRSGDFAGGAQGLFFADLRALSQIEVRLDGYSLQTLAGELQGAGAATFVLRSLTAAEPSRHRLMLVRRRRLLTGLDEDIQVRNYGFVDQPITLSLTIGTDFADLFAVKEGRPAVHGTRRTHVGTRTLLFEWELHDLRRRVLVRFDGDPEIATHGATWRLVVPGRSSVTVSFAVDVSLDQTWSARSHPVGLRDTDDLPPPPPRVRTDHPGLAIAFERAVADLDSLRLHDPVHGGPPVVAAGAPWFMTLFGRDAIITAFMALPTDPTLAYGVAAALADLQGDHDDEATEEEPGRILHEVRFVNSRNPSFRDGQPYFGTVDATPLFVVLIGELSRWGLPEPLLRPLIGNVDRAMEWIERRQVDGYLVYQRATTRGLANQGWKDSWDGVRYHDGRVANAPIALCEVQGYVYAAHLARASLAARLGDTARETDERRRARDLKRRFNTDFWSDEHGWLAMGLDADGELIDALASNMGHCLTSGIVDDGLVTRVAALLTSGPMWSGWGVRTLAATEPAYDPTSYHCGSVWPHDNAIAAAGLLRHGHRAAAHRIILGALDVARRWHGRLPELFCGIDREDIPTPIPYPTSCSPQAWAAASPMLFVRYLLGFDPDLPRNRCRVRPQLGAEIGELHVHGLRLWDRAVDVHATPRGVEVIGLPPDVDLDTP
jgi:glycogen debranching enzyme